jgi:hypothetical protein
MRQRRTTVPDGPVVVRRSIAQRRQHIVSNDEHFSLTLNHEILTMNHIKHFKSFSPFIIKRGAV